MIEVALLGISHALHGLKASIYKTEASEVLTIFHVSTIFTQYLNNPKPLKFSQFFTSAQYLNKIIILFK